MLFSNDKDYREFGRLFADGRYEDARQRLRECFQREEYNEMQKALLESFVAMTFVASRDFQLAEAHYRRAETLDPSPLSLMATARFHAEYRFDLQSALESCNAAKLKAEEYAKIDADFDFGDFIAGVDRQIRHWSHPNEST